MTSSTQGCAESAPTGLSKIPQELLNQVAELLVPLEIHVKRFDVGEDEFCFEAMDSSHLTSYMSMICTRNFQAAALDCDITLHVWIAGEGDGGFRTSNEIPAYILKCVTAVHFHFLDAKAATPEAPDSSGHTILGDLLSMEKEVLHLRRITAVFTRCAIDHSIFIIDGILIAVHSNLAMDPCKATERLRDHMTSNAVSWVQRLTRELLHHEHHVSEQGEEYKLHHLLCTSSFDVPVFPHRYFLGYGRIGTLEPFEAFDLLKGLQGNSNEVWISDSFVCQREP